MTMSNELSFLLAPLPFRYFLQRKTSNFSTQDDFESSGCFQIMHTTKHLLFIENVSNSRLKYYYIILSVRRRTFIIVGSYELQGIYFVVDKIRAVNNLNL